MVLWFSHSDSANLEPRIVLIRRRRHHRSSLHGELVDGTPEPPRRTVRVRQYTHARCESHPFRLSESFRLMRVCNIEKQLKRKPRGFATSKGFEVGRDRCHPLHRPGSEEHLKNALTAGLALTAGRRLWLLLPRLSGQGS